MVAWTDGQDAHSGNSIIILPWNDIEILNNRISKGDIAAVIMEPAMCNSGGIPPKHDYLKKVKQACELINTLLIFDEQLQALDLLQEALKSFMKHFQI